MQLTNVKDAEEEASVTCCFACSLRYTNPSSAILPLVFGNISLSFVVTLYVQDMFDLTGDQLNACTLHVNITFTYPFEHISNVNQLLYNTDRPAVQREL